ncbi:MAG TPA: efflux RND transporter periplasmic adaptor subunit, partial [Elusimicrobiales bacterium]|nr:efflux RND transporter periplasmic adaptor subunit [Elusimicrobiales bacterium]
MNKKIAVIFAITLLLVVVAGFVYSKRNGKDAKKKTYITATVSTGTISDAVDTTGEVAPLNRVEIMPSVAGRVDKLQVEEGDSIRQGQVLAYISSTDRVAILDAARAKGPGEVKYWEDAYKPTPVISPLNGRVILRNVVEGQTVNTSTTLFALSDELILIASVDESDIGRVEVGQRVSCTLDAYPGEQQTGKVFQILNEGKNVNNVITYYVKIKMNTVPQFYKSQMTANIKITVREKNNTLLLPSEAVAMGPKGERTVLTGAPPQLQEKPVVTGLDSGENVELLAQVYNESYE